MIYEKMKYKMKYKEKRKEEQKAVYMVKHKEKRRAEHNTSHLYMTDSKVQHNRLLHWLDMDWYKSEFVFRRFRKNNLEHSNYSSLR